MGKQDCFLKLYNNSSKVCPNNWYELSLGGFIDFISSHGWTNL